jgi:hypothetical protein
LEDELNTHASRKRVKANNIVADEDVDRAKRRKRPTPKAAAAAAAAAPIQKDNSGATSATTKERHKKSRTGTTDSAAAAAATTKVSKSTTKSPSTVKPRTTKRDKASQAVTPLELINCGICFEEEFESAGLIDCCQHRYCFDCIQKWSENSNTCPQCKRRFKKIVKTTVKTGKKAKSVSVKTRDLSRTSAGAGIPFYLSHVGGIPIGDWFGAGNGDTALHGLYGNPLANFVQSYLLTQELAESDDDDDEDYDEMDEYDDDVGPHYCGCCSYPWVGFPGERCPRCRCPGHGSDEDDDDDNELYYIEEDDEDPDGPGTRENPIEIDDE